MEAKPPTAGTDVSPTRPFNNRQASSTRLPLLPDHLGSPNLPRSSPLPVAIHHGSRILSLSQLESGTHQNGVQRRTKHRISHHFLSFILVEKSHRRKIIQRICKLVAEFVDILAVYHENTLQERHQRRDFPPFSRDIDTTRYITIYGLSHDCDFFGESERRSRKYPGKYLMSRRALLESIS